ncbi:hypothetical protein P691DRAFT_791162 [Macrolepiota fuliginosa MF-IS2]|uniref:Uncharacterized protein n=1 Tax=Macrolepiota fuliginosa MF-IS2 TaxID=1400762 RepID=A0A9P5XFF7_9AGAR|nr:hypothetical protein P691DRAFT_791162 [Macrolepiota fuliginosa MF-IS2]
MGHFASTTINDPRWELDRTHVGLLEDYIWASQPRIFYFTSSQPDEMVYAVLKEYSANPKSCKLGKYRAKVARCADITGCQRPSNKLEALGCTKSIKLREERDMMKVKGGVEGVGKNGDEEFPECGQRRCCRAGVHRGLATKISSCIPQSSITSWATETNSSIVFILRTLEESGNILHKKIMECVVGLYDFADGKNGAIEVETFSERVTSEWQLIGSEVGCRRGGMTGMTSENEESTNAYPPALVALHMLENQKVTNTHLTRTQMNDRNACHEVVVYVMDLEFCRDGTEEQRPESPLNGSASRKIRATRKEYDNGGRGRKCSPLEGFTRTRGIIDPVLSKDPVSVVWAVGGTAACAVGLQNVSSECAALADVPVGWRSCENEGYGTKQTGVGTSVGKLIVASSRSMAVAQYSSVDENTMGGTKSMCLVKGTARIPLEDRERKRSPVVSLSEVEQGELAVTAGTIRELGLDRASGISVVSLWTSSVIETVAADPSQRADESKDTLSHHILTIYAGLSEELTRGFLQQHQAILRAPLPAIDPVARPRMEDETIEAGLNEHNTGLKSCGSGKESRTSSAVALYCLMSNTSLSAVVCRVRNIGKGGMGNTTEVVSEWLCEDISGPPNARA